MFIWLLTKLTGDKSLKVLLRLRAEIREQDKEIEMLKGKLRQRSIAMKAIVQSAKEHSDDLWFY